MAFDLKLYDCIQTYMDHYKGYTDDTQRHLPVDTLYIVDKKHLIISIDDENYTEKRPDTSKTMVIIHKDLLWKYYPQPQNDFAMVKPDQCYFDPKSNQIKFIKGANPLWKTWHLILRADRYYGLNRPSKLTRINYNWFFDIEHGTLNFVISSCANT